MNQFLNSKSMVTPGVAGGVVTLIAGTLSSQFGLPAKWIALLASLLVALLIFFADQAEKLLARLVILVLNTMIIFSVAVGTNVTGKAVQPEPRSVAAVPMSERIPTPTPAATPTSPPFESLPPQAPLSPTATPTPAPTPTPFFHDWF